ncbi:MAG: hypothetical protein M3441_15500 [Chloroflexota bacterium]|nr:hypothetical protein [Chloroflexota bacterium]
MAVTLCGCGAPAPTGTVPTDVPTGVPATATAFPTPTAAPIATGTMPPTSTSSLAGITPHSGPGTPTRTLPTSPVTGSVLIEGGSSVAGGLSGTELQLRVTFTASSTAGEVTEMRVDAGAFGCAQEEDMSGIAWEPFEAEKVYTTTAFGNFQGWYANAQYRDVAGNVSPMYCDDISIEGMPPTPSR